MIYWNWYTIVINLTTQKILNLWPHRKIYYIRQETQSNWNYKHNCTFPRGHFHRSNGNYSKCIFVKKKRNLIFKLIFFLTDIYYETSLWGNRRWISWVALNFRLSELSNFINFHQSIGLVEFLWKFITFAISTSAATIKIEFYYFRNKFFKLLLINFEQVTTQCIYCPTCIWQSHSCPFIEKSIISTKNCP